VSPQGVLLALAATAGLVSAVWYGREFVPPAPLAMTEATVGHGTYGGYECLPPSKHVIRADQLDNLRCGSLLREPGGLKEDIVHIWRHGSVEVARVDARSSPALTKLEGCDGPDNIVYRSELPKAKLPKDPTGEWSCTTETVHGQLVGIRKFEVVGPEPSKPAPVPVPLPVPDGGAPKPPDAAPARDSR
jgi:hypothetical protein